LTFWENTLRLASEGRYSSRDLSGAQPRIRTRPRELRRKSRSSGCLPCGEGVLADSPATGDLRAIKRGCIECPADSPLADTTSRGRRRDVKHAVFNCVLAKVWFETSCERGDITVRQRLEQNSPQDATHWWTPSSLSDAPPCEGTGATS